LADLTKILNGSFVVPTPEEAPPDLQLRKAIDEAGLEPPNEIIMDGKIHRFNPDGKKNNKSGWYIVYSDKIPAGAFGDWKTGLNQRWCVDIGRPLSFDERVARDKRYEEAKRERERERKKLAESVQETVNEIWGNCAPASAEHPYLKAKGIQPHGARVSGDGRLVLPLYNEKGELVTLQYIAPDGQKLYHTGGPTSGKFWTLGEASKTIYLAEGYATAASIHEATGQAVVIAYNASNLINVAGLLREKYGQTQDVVIVGDNDESGTGQEAATKAGSKYGMKVIIPPIEGDANDYVQDGHDLLQLLQPKLDDEWLVPADSFCEKPAPLRWLVKTWVQENALIMVHGPSGGGKTFVVLSWCLHIASTMSEWCDLKVKNSPVVYLAGEGHHGLKARVAAWKHYYKKRSLSMWLSRDGCDLNTPTGYSHVIDHIRALPKKPALIVVDTLHRFLAGDENSAQDAKTMLDACAGLMREFDCSVILVHHTGVSEEAQHRARGSSAWRGALDIEVSVVPGETMQLVQRKSKDAELAESLWVNLQSVAIPGWLDEDGEQVTSAVLVPAVPPAKTKKDSKLAEFQKLFERAWFDSGAQVEDGQPYISRQKLLDFLIQQGNTEAVSKNMLKPSHTNRLIGYLINGEILAPFDKENETGWTVINQDMAGAMLTMK
jgi:phage/plasmid primase-like uncharacterized protein